MPTRQPHPRRFLTEIFHKHDRRRSGLPTSPSDGGYLGPNWPIFSRRPTLFLRTLSTRRVSSQQSHREDKTPLPIFRWTTSNHRQCICRRAS